MTPKHHTTVRFSEASHRKLADLARIHGTRTEALAVAIDRLHQEECEMYPPYGLQVYDPVQEQWIKVAHMEFSNRPHYYDSLLTEFQRLVTNAKDGASPNQRPLGYRIVRKCSGALQVIDVWTNGRVPR